MTNPFSYEGKRVVVTGAATGVGAALIEVLAELGAEHVTVLDVKPPTGPHDRYLEVNLADEAAVDAAIKRAHRPGARALQQRRRRRHVAAAHRHRR